MELKKIIENITGQQAADVINDNNQLLYGGTAGFSRDQIPDYSMPVFGRGINQHTNYWKEDPNYGVRMTPPAGAVGNGQHIWFFNNIPVFYDSDKPHILRVEAVVNYIKPSKGFNFYTALSFRNRAGYEVKQVTQITVDPTTLGADDTHDGLLYTWEVDLRTVAETANSGISDKGYILVGAFCQIPVDTTFKFTEDQDIYVSYRSMYFKGYTNRNTPEYIERSTFIGHGIPLPFSVTNTAYQETKDGPVVSHPNQNGATFEAGTFVPINFAFDLKTCDSRFFEDIAGQAFYIRFKYRTENMYPGNTMLESIDSYLIKENFTNGKAILVWWNPNEGEGLLRVFAKDVYFLRLIFPNNFTVKDTTKPCSVKLSDVSIIFDFPGMYEKYKGWDFAEATNGGTVNEISEWAYKNSVFPIKYLNDGEQFYGGRNDTYNGRLIVPRYLSEVNPNYIALRINKDVWHGLVKPRNKNYGENKTIYLSWLLKVKIAGHGKNGKDDWYYNSADFGFTPTDLFSANPAEVVRATGQQVYYPTKGVQNDPYFILRGEYHINMDVDLEDYLGGIGLQLYAFLKSVPDNFFDIEIKTLGCFVAGLDNPVVENQLSRALQSSTTFDQKSGIPVSIGIATGKIKRHLTEQRGDVLEGDTGNADNLSPAFAGYYSLDETAQHDGAVVSAYINSYLDQTVDLVVGLVDQNNIIVPSVVVSVALTAGKNKIGWYNRNQSPLPIRKGERLFIRQNTANEVPYMAKEGENYIYTTSISNPVVQTAADKLLDFRYIIDYYQTPAYPVPSREEYAELKDKVETLVGDNFGIPIFSPNGAKWYIRVRDNGELYTDINTFDRLCIIGNSITWHGIVDYWWGTWGMAATVREKDYANLIWAQVKKGNPSATLDYFNFALWETATTSVDRLALLPQYLDEHLALNPDCVVIRLSENVQPAGMVTLTDDYRAMLQYIKSKVPDAKIFVGGSFWVADAKDAAIKAACDAEGVSFSKQSQLDTAENRSAVGTQVYGDDGLWHTINHDGVANHPGDKGMEAIANIFIEQMGI